MYLSTNHALNRKQKGVTFTYKVTTVYTKVRDTVDLSQFYKAYFDHHSFPVNHVFPILLNSHTVTFTNNVTTVCTKVQDTVDMAPVLQSLF